MENVQRIAHALQGIDWHTVFFEVLKHVVLSVENAQQPLHLYGFEIEATSLDTVYKVAILAIWCLKLFWLNF